MLAADQVEAALAVDDRVGLLRLFGTAGRALGLGVSQGDDSLKMPGN
jgi:hypothetical protein